jgi:hypothetical protein
VASAWVLMATASILAEDRRFQGPALEQFLAQAEVGNVRPIGRGVTKSRRITLVLDGVTHDGAFKTVNIAKPGLTRLPGGRPELDFEDTYRGECAAYLLDRLLELEMVPATVERTIGGERGSVSLWITPAISEAERAGKDLVPPDAERWAQQVYRARYFDNLIYNTDRNLHNMLVTPEFELRLIDHSRAFRRTPELRNPRIMARFSKSLLETASRLDEDTLKTHLGRYISIWQIKAILERRDRLADLARQRVASIGEAAALFP